MDEDEIARRLLNLKVDTLGKTPIELPKNLTESSELQCKNSVLIKIFTDKYVSFDGLHNVLSVMWQFASRFTVASLGYNLFQVMFEQPEDMERVLLGCPWYHNSCMMVIKRWRKEVNFREDFFNIPPIWVQIWNLPLEWTSKDTGKHICNQFGIVSEVEVIAGGNNYGKIIRAKVTMDISKPLLRGVSVSQEGRTVWATCRYENLSYFCHYCGIIGHISRNCPHRVMDQCKGIYKDELFGPELRAPQLKQKLGKMALVCNRSKGNELQEIGRGAEDVGNIGLLRFAGEERGKERKEDDNQSDTGSKILVARQHYSTPAPLLHDGQSSKKAVNAQIEEDEYDQQL